MIPTFKRLGTLYAYLSARLSNNWGNSQQMEPRDKRDLQTASLFVVLAVLTAVFVFGIRVVLFAPIADGGKMSPAVIEAQKAPGSP